VAGDYRDALESPIQLDVSIVTLDRMRRVDETSITTKKLFNNFKLISTVLNTHQNLSSVLNEVDKLLTIPDQVAAIHRMLEVDINVSFQEFGISNRSRC
jgi:hypothetical protein